MSALESAFSKMDSAFGDRVGFLLKKPACVLTPCTASLVLAKNGDCGGESALITTQGNSLDSPCKAPFLSQNKGYRSPLGDVSLEKSCREQTAPESSTAKQATAVQGVSTQAGFFRIPRILEKDNHAEREKSPQSSLRGSKATEAVQPSHSVIAKPFRAEAIHNSATAQSNQINGVCEAKPKLSSPFLRHCEARAKRVTKQSIKKTHKKADSSVSVDCHDFLQKSRNDQSTLNCHATTTAESRNDTNADFLATLSKLKSHHTKE